MDILDRIQENIQKYADRNVYIHMKSEERCEKMTWRQFGKESESLAGCIDASNHSKAPVVIYGHKSAYMLIAFLACVKSGRAYCPIDVSIPDERIVSIIKSVKPELIINLSEKDMKIFDGYHVWDMSQTVEFCKKGTKVPDDKRVNAEDVFYIIYTSGSTGNPKGVQITTSCLNNFVKWAETLGRGIDYKKNNMILNTAPFSFDLSVMDVYLSLYTGSTLVTFDKDLLGNIRVISNYCSKFGVNVIVATPSFVNMCLADPDFNCNSMQKVERFLFCGETLSPKLVSKIRERFSASEIVNTYGPTESTCAITEVLITDSIINSYNPLPIGKPKKGTWILIKDEDGNVLQEGNRGEIVIVGDSVSIGYYGQPDLSAQKFSTTEIDGIKYRTYKTGDAGYIKDGLLFYDGRIDLQVKINGYRIELEDIENNLVKIEGIDDVVVVANYKNETEVKSLTAYVVSNKDEITIDYVRNEAQKYLPGYMIPKRIVFVDYIPMTVNGKKDRKKIQEIRSAK